MPIRPIPLPLPGTPGGLATLDGDGKVPTEQMPPGGDCQVPAHLIAYDHGLLHSNSLDHPNTNDPAEGEKAALAGTSGTPGSGNKYVTNADSRNSDARTPLTHSHVPGDVTGTAVINNDSRLSDARTPTTHGSDKHSEAYLASTAFSGLAKITVGTSAPGSPGVNDLWVDTN